MACTAGRRRSCGVLYREIDSSQPGNGGVTMSAAASSLSKERQHRMKTSNQDEIVTKHAPLVKRIAYHLMSRLPPSVQADDLIQAGMIGLLEASRNYDAGQGASFETYAGIRIRGAMLDEIRRNDCAPGSVDRVQNDAFKRSLSDAIASLPDRERLVMTLYYDEELNLREIGAVIGVSESRVSQIHSQALIRLQARLGRWLDNDET